MLYHIELRVRVPEVNIIVHYPENEEKLRELHKIAAEVYAQAVIRTVKNLTCSEEQKSELIKDIKLAVTQKGE